MKQEDLNKTFMMISNKNKPFGRKVFYKKKSALQGLMNNNIFFNHHIGL